MPFDSYLDARQVTAKEWMLLKPLVYDAGRFGKFTVPEGFTCDYCSVPRLPFAYLICGGIGQGAGTVHDYAYRNGKNDEGKELTRDEADRVFYMALRDLGISAFKAGLMYRAVSLFAGKIWDAYRRKEK